MRTLRPAYFILVLPLLSWGLEGLPAQRSSPVTPADSAAAAGVRRNNVGAPRRPRCEDLACAPSNAGAPGQDSTQASTGRGRYAWWGLAIGAAAGWLVTWQACRNEDCYGSGFGFVTLVGGALGLLVGLLASPG